MAGRCRRLLQRYIRDHDVAVDAERALLHGDRDRRIGEYAHRPAQRAHSEHVFQRQCDALAERYRAFVDSQRFPVDVEELEVRRRGHLAFVDDAERGIDVAVVQHIGVGVHRTPEQRPFLVRGNGVHAARAAAAPERCDDRMGGRRRTGARAHDPEAFERWLAVRGRLVYEYAARIDRIAHRGVAGDLDLPADGFVTGVHEDVLHVLPRARGQRRQDAALGQQTGGRCFARRHRRGREQRISATVGNLEQRAHAQRLVRVDAEHAMQVRLSVEQRGDSLRKLSSGFQATRFVRALAARRLEFEP